jgi:hypothetical protein
MKRYALAVLLLSTSALAVLGPRSTAFTVTTSVTALTVAVPASSKYIRVDNNGANAIWCRYQTPSETTTPSFVAGQGMKIASGSWATFAAITLWCVAETASQTGCSGSATDCTWVSEVDQ